MEGTETISRMTSLAETIRAEFESMNIFGETRPFKPHMTVAKMSRSKKLQRKVCVNKELEYRILCSFLVSLL